VTTRGTATNGASASDARDYLADDFAQQADDLVAEGTCDPAMAEGYLAFEAWLRARPADDPRLARLAQLLRPFLDDDPRLDGTLYPDGDAIRFMDAYAPTTDPDVCSAYLDDLLAHLARDYRRWQQQIAAAGPSATWRLGQRPPDDPPVGDDSSAGPEASTRAEIEARLRDLTDEQADRIRQRLQPRPEGPPQTCAPAPEPTYSSWQDYLERTTNADRRAWCARKAKVANRERLMSGRPEHRLGTEDVWRVLEAAQGRCAGCGSLAVERRPSKPNGAPMPWEHVGRRIGSLGHALARVHGGQNTADNLAWTCLWCNTWPSERRPGATDHGGIQP